MEKDNDFLSAFVDMVAEKLATRGVAPAVKDMDVGHIPKFYSVDDVCGMLKISKATFYRHKNLGYVRPDRYVGRKPLFTQASIDNYLSQFSVN